jgi:hypothetical protein
VFQLPPFVREAGGHEEQRAAVERMWNEGLLSHGEREALLGIIEVLRSGSSGDSA